MASTGSATSIANTSVTQDQFLQLLVAQLQNQDPLNPTDSTTFITQLAQFSQLQEVQKQSASFAQMLSLQQLTQGSNLIGKSVSFTPTNGTPTTGKVSSVSVSNGNVFLSIGGASVPLSQVTQVLS